MKLSVIFKIFVVIVVTLFLNELYYFTLYVKSKYVALVLSTILEYSGYRIEHLWYSG